MQPADSHHNSVPNSHCSLCGLPLSHGRITLDISGNVYAFCCMGCRQVFTILTEASDAADSSTFKETDLFKQCVQAGIIPASEADLVRLNTETKLSRSAAEESFRDTVHTDVSPDTLSLSLRVGNMWCPACAWLIDVSLEKTPGVVEAVCNFSTDRLQVRYDPVHTSPDRIAAVVGKLGYRVSPAGSGHDTAGQRKEFVRFGICAFLTMNVMMLSFALYSGFFVEYSPENIAKMSWPLFVMTAAVLAYGGQELFRKALAGLNNAAFSMETLIIIGSMSAFIYSTVNVVSGSIHLYFDTACMLITLVLLGKTLEGRAKRRVLEDLEAFFSLMPTKVRICSSLYPQGRYAAIDQLTAGDEFRLGAGEIVPADGRVCSGSGTVDESPITGEPLPVTKTEGNHIRSGSRLIRGDLKIVARRTGKDSTMGQMIQIIQETLLSKTPLEGKTDLILQWFVPAILLLATATALISMLFGISPQEAILRAVTVTVISCPCALGIAIPLARVAGVSIAGQKGILVRDFSAFEQARAVDTIVFDKTGTVTLGHWKLLRILPFESWTEKQVLAMAAGLEAGSEHVIALEILKQARDLDIAAESIEDINVTEEGRRGHFKGQTVKLGSEAFLSEELRHLARPLRRISGIDPARQSPVYMSWGGRPAAVFVFGDTLRPGVADMVNELLQRNYRIALISGDHQPTTEAVAREIGIAQAFGNRLPADKAAYICDLQQEGRRVAMVGDGINDAPALVQADLSFAVYSGGSLGKESAEISFMRGDPGQLPAFLDFAARVNRKIHQNLTFTFLYNIVSIPIAMSGLLNPLIAVCAMLLSSLSVTGNTLLLVMKSKKSTFEDDIQIEHW